MGDALRVSLLALIACSAAFAGAEAGNHRQGLARVGEKFFGFCRKKLYVHVR
jgi:hypothetical protein